MEKLERSCRLKYISDLRAWRQYGCIFITMTGWLLKKEKISEDKFVLAFWSGIHKKLRRKLENWLITSDPSSDFANPFTYEEVNEAAEKVLMRDRFDTNISELDTDASEDDRRRSKDKEDENTSDSELEDLKKWEKKARRKTKKPAKKRASSSEDKDKDEEDFPKPARPSKPPKHKVGTTDKQEIKGMIKQLNLMKIDNPRYTVLVFGALKRDPDVLR